MGLGPTSFYLHYLCKDPIFNKVTFWGTGGLDFKIWIWGGGNPIQPIAAATSYLHL